MSEANGEAKRVEETMLYMMKAFHFEGAVIARCADITLTWVDDQHQEHVRMARIQKHSYHVGHIAAINDISRRLVEGKVTCEEAYVFLTGLRNEESRKQALWQQRIGLLFLGSAFVFVFGGQVFDALACVLTGMVYTGLWELQRRFGSKDIFHFLCASTILCILVQALVSLAHHYGVSLHQDVILTSSLMPMVPGIGLTYATMDILNHDFLSGQTRLMEALIQALSIAAGIGFGFSLGGVWSG